MINELLVYPYNLSGNQIRAFILLTLRRLYCLKHRRLRAALEPLLFFLFEFLNALGRRRQVLRQRAAQFFYKAPNLVAYVLMDLISRLFTLDLLSLQLLLGLRGPEEVSRQLVAAHMIEYLLIGLQSLAPVNIQGLLTPVEAHIAVVLEDCEVRGSYHPGLVGGRRQLFVVVAKLAAQE